MIEKSKLIEQIINKANISEKAALIAYDCLLSDNPIFRQQSHKVTKAVKEKLVKVPAPATVKEVKLTKNKIVAKPTTIEKIKKVTVNKNVPLYKKEEKIKKVEVVKEVLVPVIKEVIKEVVKEVKVRLSKRSK